MRMIVRRHVEVMLTGWHGAWIYRVMGCKEH
jgi:hypothetical protein